MEQQIKALLSSPEESNQRLGCIMAKSLLKWSNFDVCMYILNTRKNWKVYRNLLYGIEFLGGKIYYSLEFKCIRTNCQSRLTFKGLNRKRIGIIFLRTDRNKPNMIHLKSYCNKFINQNL